MCSVGPDTSSDCGQGIRPNRLSPSCRPCGLPSVPKGPFSPTYQTNQIKYNRLLDHADRTSQTDCESKSYVGFNICVGDATLLKLLRTASRHPLQHKRRRYRRAASLSNQSHFFNLTSAFCTLLTPAIPAALPPPPPPSPPHPVPRCLVPSASRSPTQYRSSPESHPRE